MAVCHRWSILEALRTHFCRVALRWRGLGVSRVGEFFDVILRLFHSAAVELREKNVFVDCLLRGSDCVAAKSLGKYW